MLWSDNEVGAMHEALLGMFGGRSTGWIEVWRHQSLIPSWLKLRPSWSPQLAPHWLALLLLVVPGTDTAAQGSTVNVGKRTALVLGNQDYKFAPLGNPLNDARAISVSLRELGFDVLMVKDGKLSGMRETLQQAKSRFVSNGVAFFYYAGHAVQYRGINYLVPVDYSPEDLASFPEGTLSLDEVLGVMAEAGVGLRILVLDSCRDNPFGSAAEVLGEGLASIETEGETFVAYATTAGNVAEDGASGPNSPFTAALITALEVPNLDIHDVFRLVRGNVREATQGRQVPWTSGSIETRFIFREQGTTVSSPTPATAADVVSVHWETIKNSVDPSDFAEFVRVHAYSTLAVEAQSALTRLRAEGRQPSEPPIVLSPEMQRIDPAAAVTPCDVWASSPIDPSRIAPGIPRGLVNTRQALRACAIAVAENPDSPRLLFQLGRALTLSGRFEEAVGFYLRADAGGYLVASNSLGALYRRGRGAPRDTAKAVKYILSAAVRGLPAARLALANLLRDGDGVPMSAELSLYWMQLAADAGYDPAIDALANLYRSGIGVASNPLKAIELYERAAALENSNAMSNLGAMYIKGEGVPTDVALGIQWYERATDAGSAFAPYQLARIYRIGEFTPKNMRRARELLDLALERGYEWAPYQIGDMYARGDLGDQDFGTAYYYVGSPVRRASSDKRTARAARPPRWSRKRTLSFRALKRRLESSKLPR